MRFQNCKQWVNHCTITQALHGVFLTREWTCTLLCSLAGHVTIPKQTLQHSLSSPDARPLGPPDSGLWTYKTMGKNKTSFVSEFFSAIYFTVMKSWLNTLTQDNTNMGKTELETCLHIPQYQASMLLKTKQAEIKPELSTFHISSS